MVGSSGISVERDFVVTASALSLPALMSGTVGGMLPMNATTWPETTSVSAGELPL